MSKEDDFCPYCEGLGYLDSEQTCHPCEGAGKQKPISIRIKDKKMEDNFQQENSVQKELEAKKTVAEHVSELWSESLTLLGNQKELEYEKVQDLYKVCQNLQMMVGYMVNDMKTLHALNKKLYEALLGIGTQSELVTELLMRKNVFTLQELEDLNKQLDQEVVEEQKEKEPQTE